MHNRNNCIPINILSKSRKTFLLMKVRLAYISHQNVTDNPQGSLSKLKLIVSRLAKGFERDEPKGVK